MAGEAVDSEGVDWVVSVVVFGEVTIDLTGALLSVCTVAGDDGNVANDTKLVDCTVSSEDEGVVAGSTVAETSAVLVVAAGVTQAVVFRTGAVDTGAELGKESILIVVTGFTVVAMTVVEDN